MKKLLFIFLLIPFFGLGQVQIGNDIDGDNEFDYLGSAVSLSLDGSIIAVGATAAIGNNNSGTNLGYVRIYENQSGNWGQIGQDISAEALNDQFGYSVSLSSDGSIVAIGAPFNDDNGIDSGYVRVYENQSGNWVQIGADINGEAADDQSGSAVSLSSDGSIIAIGAPNNNGSDFYSGHVRVYENQSGSWVQIGQDIDGEFGQDNSGFSLSLSNDGSVLAIGAITNGFERGLNFLLAGHVRVYENVNNSWNQIGQDIDGEEGYDLSGFSVSLSADGSIVAIGAPNNGFINNDSGHVRVFQNFNSVWTQIGSDIDGSTGEYIGTSVSLSSDGSIVAIGSRDAFPSTLGKDRVFKNQIGNWVEVGNGFDGEDTFNQAGTSVSLSLDGFTLAIGTKVNSENGNGSGHVRVYSIASELAILEIVEDIAGNSNGINITAAQLNAIEGVSGALDGVDYTTAFQNGTYADPSNPTAIEIQAVINQVNETLGVNKNDIFNFNIYPNPTKTKFTIQLENTTELENVNIYNNLGQLVFTSKKSIIDTSKLASGLYIVELETNKGKGSKKLIIE